MCWGGRGGGLLPKKRGSNEPFRTLAAILFQIFASKKEEGEEKKKKKKDFLCQIYAV